MGRNGPPPKNLQKPVIKGGITPAFLFRNKRVSLSEPEKETNDSSLLWLLFFLFM
jgi:hypothetical protein